MNSIGSIMYNYIRVKSVLSKSKLPDLDYALNPYIGCEHGCIYCYGPDMCRRYLEVALNWGSTVLIKSNLISVLRKDLKHAKRGTVGISTATDPYQPVEGRLGITREAINILLNHGFKVSIQSKSNTVTRDLDLMSEGNIDVGLTITTLNDALASIIEPKAPRPYLRAKAAYEISANGIELWIFLGPIIPLVNDDENNINEVVELAASVNAYVIYDKLNVKPLMLYNLRRKWTLKADLDEVIRLSSDRNYVRNLSITISNICRKHRVKCVPAFRSLVT